MKRLLTAGAAWLVLLAAGRAEAPKAEVQAKPKFTRFVEDASGARLQTGVRSYRNKEGVQVDLIGAIHIADKAYYEKLNARFTRYDAMLYEMVGESVERRRKWKAMGDKVAANAPGDAKDKEKDKDKALPEEERVVKQQEEEAGQNLQWLHPLYETMEKSLALTGQLDGVDYRAPNFVHADMTMREFAAAQQKKGESFLKLWWKSVVVQIEHPESGPEQPGLLKIMEILCRKDSSTELKRIMGRVFGAADSMMAGLEAGGGTVILTERNKVALQTLQNQIALGRKNLALFYGAAHLQDMDQRLHEMGFETVGWEWFTAWDLPPPPPEAPKARVGEK